MPPSAQELPPDARRAAASATDAHTRKTQDFLDTLRANAASDRPVWDVRPAAAPAAAPAASAAGTAKKA